ncbi:MAG: hypothetical protein ACUVQZ_01570 [Candidatus Caldatribacteriaceae bacterium]
MIILLYLGLVFLAYLVPFTVLSRITSVWGSFFFWVVFALFSVGLLMKIMSFWKDER